MPAAYIAGSYGCQLWASPKGWHRVRAYLLGDGVGLHTGASHLACNSHGTLVLVAAVAGGDERVEDVDGGGQPRGAHALLHPERGAPVALERVRGDEAAVGVVAWLEACTGWARWHRCAGERRAASIQEREMQAGAQRWP